MIEMYSLISGSSGNSTLITDGKTNLLVDCGTSGKRIFAALEQTGAAPADIDALLVTHEHSDHTKGVGVVARRLGIPIYATSGTHRNMEIGAVNDSQIRIIASDSPFSIGGIDVMPFEIPHDAAEPCGYCFSDGSEKVAVATDIGHMNDYLMNQLSGCSDVLLESNHDVDMLRYGEYPYMLKKRILGDFGHLSNASAAHTALELVKRGTKHIMLGHLSDKNNLPEIAKMETFNFLTDNGVRIGSDVTLQVAERYSVTAFLR